MLSELLLLFIIPVIGCLLTFSISRIQRYHKWLLTFSGAYLISIVFLHIMPELFHGHQHNIGIYILLGFFIQVLLDFLSKGIEHGHAHLSPEKPMLGVLIGLYLHAFIEAIPLGMEEVTHIDTNHSFFTGILLHKLPIAIVLTSLLIGRNLNKKIILMHILAFSMIAPLGYLYGHYFASSSFMSMEALTAVVVGIFLHVGTTIIFESSDTHSINMGKLVAILAGIALSVLLIV